jgi:protein gp37
VNGLCQGGGFPCYAYKLAHGRVKQRYLANFNIAEGVPFHTKLIHYPYSDPFYPRFWPNRLHIPKSKTPRGIFTCDMSDLFGIGVPEAWTWEVLEEIRRHPGDRFYLLTKQPKNLAKFSPFPDNCWVGVTVCNQAMANASIPLLMNIEAGRRYVSVEPMLEPIDLSKIEFGHYLPENKPYYVNALEDRYIFGDEGDIELRKIDWLIIGAQTKPYKPPELASVREIVKAADEAGIPVFLKDSLYKLAMDWPIEDHDLYWEDMSTLRQELPERMVKV